MPARANVSRDWFFRNGRSSTRPTHSGCRSSGSPPANKAATSVRGDAGKSDPTVWCVDLDQRFQRIRAARSVADDARVERLALDRGSNCCSDGVGAERTGAGVVGDEDSGRHVRSPVNGASNSSKRSGVTRPWISSSMRTVGPHAQLPKQYAASSLTLRSRRGRPHRDAEACFGVFCQRPATDRLAGFCLTDLNQVTRRRFARAGRDRNWLRRGRRRATG